MSWRAKDARTARMTHVLEIGLAGVRLESGGQVREFPLHAEEIGVAKWMHSPPGSTLVLGAKDPFCVGATGAHYGYESRAPRTEVDATLSESEFHELMRDLQSAWRSHHAAGDGYRARRALPTVHAAGVSPVSRFTLGHLGRHHRPVCRGLVRGRTETASGHGWAFVRRTCAAADWALRVAARLELRRPSYSLLLEGDRVYIKHGLRTLAEARLAEVEFRFDGMPDEARVSFPGGRSYRLISRLRYRQLPFGVFPNRERLFLDRTVIPLLQNVLRASSEVRPSPGRVRVVADAENLAEPPPSVEEPVEARRRGRAQR